MKTFLHRCRHFGAPFLAVAWATTILLTVHAQNDSGRTDAIARLDRQIDNGAATLDYRAGFGYLPSLLEHLGVGTDSQVLVFSKTSFQQALISPRNPRALYFSDDVAVGMVPGGEVYELAAIDSEDGIAFYTLSTKQTERPRFKRRGVECLFCHSPGNKGAPGLVVASVFPAADGTPAYSGTFISTIDHRTPLEDRWGGWYVTGTHGSQTHRGNAIALDPDRPFELQQTRTQNVTSLAGRFPVSNYLTPSSDIVALMTLEHQVGAINRINALSFEYRRAERSGVIKDAVMKRIDADIDDLVGYLLFVDETRLREPVQGTSAFTTTFPKGGPRDARGRSLRDFDLRTRLFRYPLSYLIYSDLFDGMPSVVRQTVYRRIYDILVRNNTDKRYANLSDDDRKSILEIVLGTKKDLPPYFAESSGPVGLRAPNGDLLRGRG